MKIFYALLLTGFMCCGLHAQNFWKQYAPTNFTYNASVLTPDGGLMVVTNAVDTGWMVPRLMRIDSAGGIVWSVQMNFYPEMISGRFVDIVPTSDSCFLAVGQMNAVGQYSGLFMQKFDINGGIKWSKMIIPGSCNGGISGGYESHCVVEAKDHGFAVSGSTGGSVGNGMFLLKTDSTGNPEWFKVYHDYNNLKFWYRNLCQDADSGFVLFNQYNSLNQDAMLIHTDQSGNLLMSATLDSTNAVVLNALYNIDGQVYLCFGNGFVPTSMDTMGFTFDTYLMNQIPSSKFRSLEKCHNSDFVLTMSDGQSFGTLRTDSTGNTIWAHSFGPNPVPVEMFELPDGRLMCQGTAQGFTNYTNVILFDSTGASDCLNNPTTVTIAGAQERLRIAPVFEATCSLTVYPNTSDWHNAGTMFNQCQQTFVGHEESPMISVFPNPTTGHLLLSGLNTPGTIEIFSMDGKKLMSGEVQNQTAEFDLSAYQTGVYMIRAVNAGSLTVTRIILQ